MLEITFVDGYLSLLRKMDVIEMREKMSLLRKMDAIEMG